MGAWGTGIFEDDSALDRFEELIGSDSIDFFKEAIDIGLSSEYLDYDDCFFIIIAGAAIDGIINGTNHNPEDDEFKNWVSDNKKLKLNDLIDDIVSGLRKVLSDNSELNELRAESDEDYHEWKGNINDIIIRLSH